MPSTATITAFYSFTANTKARAALVNTNFSNFRGHIVAIDPNTQTASNETYDLGSTEYRWRTGYFREVDFKSNTTTAGRTKFVGDTTGVIDVFISGSTLGSFKSDGFTRGGIKKSQLYYSYFGLTAGNYDLSATSINVFTLSVTSNGHIGLVGMNLFNDTDASGMAFFGNATAFARVSIYRDGTAASNLVYKERFFPGQTVTQASYFAKRINFYDTSITSGNHTYYMYMQTGDTSTLITITPNSDKLCFLEII